MAGLDSIGTVAIGMPEVQRSTVHRAQRARRSALGGHARRRGCWEQEAIGNVGRKVAANVDAWQGTEQ